MKKTILLTLLCLSAMFASTQVSEDFDFTHEGYTLHGTITKPNHSGVFPLLVICPGSGANDRNATLPMYGSNVQCMYPDLSGDTLQTYKDLAEGLTARGYAVLRYDKIEYTYSNIGPVTFKKLWLPFMSAVDYAKTRSDIDVSQIVLMGHSEGGTLVPYAARSRTDIKALINIAGARTPFDSLLAYQYRVFPRMCGQDTTQSDIIALQILSYFSLIRSGNWNGSTPPFAGASAAVWSQYTEIGDSVVINYNLNAKPLLFIGLEKDNNVPVETEYERFKKEITVPASFVRLPNLIHYMNPLNNPKTSPALVDTIVYWLQNKGITGVADAVYSHRKVSVLYDKQFIRIESGDDILQSAIITDMAGRKITEITGPEIILNRALFETGIYVVTINGEKQAYITKVSM